MMGASTSERGDTTMFTNMRIALALCTMTVLFLGGLSLPGAKQVPQAAHAPGREVVGSYVDGSGNEHEITIGNGGWSHLDLIVYRRFELAPVKDGEKWQVKIFSDGTAITTTMLFASEDSAVTEAKNIVDGM
jgi:hypothetical protein